MARITVVNDYPEFIAIMQELVDRAGDHEFCGFDGTKSTYAEIAATAPDVLIIDLRLASDGLTGWDVLALARADDALRDVPIIVCSADIGQLRQRAADFERIGNIHVRLKPFDTSELIDLINELAHHGRNTASRAPGAP